MSLCIFGLLMSCNKQHNKTDLKAGFISFLSEKQDWVGYGRIDLNSILRKGDVANMKMSGFDIGDYYAIIESSINLEGNMYFALEGPLLEKEPKVTYLFMSVKSRSGLQKSLQDLGLFFGKNQGVEVFSSDKIALGFDDHSLVVAFGKPSEVANVKIKRIIEQLSKAANMEPSDYVLETKTDFLFIAELENIHKSYPAFLSEIPQIELSEGVAGGRFVFKADFESGKIVGELDISMVSDKLKELFLLRENGNNEIVETITERSNDMTVMLNFDSEKLDELLDKYAVPKSKYLRPLGLPGMMIEAIVDDSIANLTNGEVGMGMINKSVTVMDIINLPEMTFFLRMGRKSEDISELFETFVKVGMMGKHGKDIYRYNDTKFQVSGNTLILDTRSASQEKNRQLKEIKSFTKTDSIRNSPLFLAVRPQQFPDFLAENNELKRGATLTELIKVYGNNEGLSIEVLFKDSETNALKQILNSYANELSH